MRNLCAILILLASTSLSAQKDIIAEGSYTYFPNDKPAYQLSLWRVHQLPKSAIEVEVVTRNQKVDPVATFDWSIADGIRQRMHFSKEGQWDHYDLTVPTSVDPEVSSLSCAFTASQLSCSISAQHRKVSGQLRITRPSLLSINEFRGRELAWFMTAAVRAADLKQPNSEANFDLMVIDVDDDDKPKKATLKKDYFLRLKYLGDEDLDFMGHVVPSRKFRFTTPNVTAWFTKSGFLLQAQSTLGRISLSDFRQTAQLIPELK